MGPHRCRAPHLSGASQQQTIEKRQQFFHQVEILFKYMIIIDKKHDALRKNSLKRARHFANVEASRFGIPQHRAECQSERCGSPIHARQAGRAILGRSVQRRRRRAMRGRRR
jgi:hypothetical protein